MSTTPSTTPVTVYAESTPNPASMKFVVNGMILPEGYLEYFSPEAAADCPLAAQLFGFSGIRSVFLSANFITITKTQDLEWDDMVHILREFIRSFIQSGEKIFSVHPAKELMANEEYMKDVSAGNEETVQKIREVMDEYIRPAVEGDGGAIDLKSYVNGIVTVSLRGSCSGCPSSTLTLKAGIENLLKQMVPGVQEVIAESL